MHRQSCPTALFFCFLLGFASFAQADHLDLQKQVAAVFKQHQTAVVRIKAQRQELNPAEDKPRIRLTIGSGFFVRNDGHVLTNFSLVYQMDRVLVEYPAGREFPAEIKGMDPYSNIALLKIKSLPSNATFVRMDDPSTTPEIGHMAVAITCPLQFAPSPSLGLVTGHESSIGRQAYRTSIIRTSIRTQPGDSGSPLFGIDGRFLGINVASIKELQATCIFPARATKRILDDLLSTGRVEYCTIGLKVVQRIDPTHGPRLIVTEPLSDYPSFRAGLKKDDWIKATRTGPIKSLSDLQNALFFTRPGQSLELTVVRDGREILFSVPVEAIKPKFGAEEEKKPVLPKPPQGG